MDIVAKGSVPRSTFLTIWLMYSLFEFLFSFVLKQNMLWCMWTEIHLIWTY